VYGDMITIGLDPHPDSHTVAALDEHGTTLASSTVSNDAEGLARLHQFARSFPKRRWAIEGAANRFILPFVCELLKQGETVTTFPPKSHQSVPCSLKQEEERRCGRFKCARALLANP
jgi:hypothetical protein